MRALCLLPLLLSSAFAATHVNISIAQHPVDEAGFVDGKASSAQLRTASSGERHQSDFSFRGDGNQQRFAKLQSTGKGGGNFEYAQDRARFSGGGGGGGGGGGRQVSGFNYGARSARIQLAGNSGQVQLGQQQGFQQQQNNKVRLANEQDKQNQEFERYIQNYHTGPTVETVYESASPAPQLYKQSSSSVSSSSSAGGTSARLVAIGSRPTQVHSFERQVALPVTPSNLLPSADADRQTHTIVNHQPKPTTELNQQDSSLSSSSTSASSSGGNVNYNFNQQDQPNFDDAGNYNKPSYDQSNYNYEGTSQTDLQAQYPPIVDEKQNGGYDGYYGGNDQSNFYGQVSPTPTSGYLPPSAYPRPVVTKTIQIAQPAVKAKKYEVRHPAIQKEFYDIEERVVIKPAGTVVVELERPVAKIPRGETILPLGYPHPAVADAYNTNGQGVSQVQTSSSTGSYSSSSTAQNNQYSPSPVYTPKAVPDHPVISGSSIASTITTTPTYDQSSKDEFVEANLNRQYTGEVQYVTTERNYNDDKQGAGGVFIATDSQGNQQQISGKNFSPRMFNKEEANLRYPSQVDIKSNGAPGPSTSFGSSYNYNANNYGQAAYVPNQPQFQAKYNGNGNQYKGEYFTGEFYNNANNQQDYKPARLQEQPLNTADNQGQVIKHEHNIHLPATQHNIFVGRLEQGSTRGSQPLQSAQLKQSRYEEEAARVLELKPYSQQQQGGGVIYASANIRPAARYSQGYESQRYRQPQMVQYRGQLRSAADGANRVQYSAPYAQMRYIPQESARYTYGDRQIYAGQSYAPSDASYSYNRDSNRKANLILENNNDNNNDDRDSSNLSSQLETDKLEKKSDERAHTHIEIKIPHHTEAKDKPIYIGSTISPPLNQQRTANYRSSASDSSSNYAGNNADVETGFQRGDQEYGVRAANLESKPDCDQPTSNLQGQRSQQKLQRLVEADGEGDAAPALTDVQTSSVDVGLKSVSGHVATAGSRVIAATPAPSDASSESFHKRRIVVNHPFQTVREVVEHEPITNYHQVQVNEPATLYNQAGYYQEQMTHGALRQAVGVPVVYHHSASAHGNFVPVHGVAVGYHHNL